MTQSIKLSIIIPTLNESRSIAPLLKSFHGMPGMEAIVSDGGSVDGTLDLAKENGAITVASPPGRGTQLNKGAALARGKILLFLHADSRISDEGIHRVIEAMSTGKYAGGAFYLAVDGAGKLLRFVACAANIRSMFFKIAYGDQGIFVGRERFERLNGFKEIPLMEDYDFFRRLQNSGKIILIKKGLATSPRRWEKEGIFYATIRNWAIFSLYLLGVPPASLKKWYGSV
ncbi:MAG: TIGR04283 family arsenosugar biosynthesis glycosyltransferase [Nitrospinae bacterium]|nr:TIGR04283 family arsenosugar biosynthesis glycosyltransferase [Nitrospinota bacterium]